MTDQISPGLADKEESAVDKDLDIKEERTADVLLEHAWADYAVSREEKETLDNKANYILVANGVFLGFIFNTLDKMDTIHGIGALILLISSSVFSVHALTLRSYVTVQTMELWNGLQKIDCIRSPCSVKKNVMATIADSVKKNRNQCRKIIQSLEPALFLFIAGSIVAMVAIALPYGQRNWGYSCWGVFGVDFASIILIYEIYKWMFPKKNI